MNEILDHMNCHIPTKVKKKIKICLFQNLFGSKFVCFKICLFVCYTECKRWTKANILFKYSVPEFISVWRFSSDQILSFLVSNVDYYLKDYLKFLEHKFGTVLVWMVVRFEGLEADLISTNLGPSFWDL